MLMLMGMGVSATGANSANSLLTEDGEPFTTEDGDEIVVEDAE